MAEHFRFMDPVQLPDGTYDREYNAQEFTDYFKALVTTGIMKSEGAQLKVTTNGTNMESSIDTGIAFILGRYYENDGVVKLTHDTETLGNNRIDRIVIRMDLNPEKRHVLSFIKKGAPSKTPVAPALTQNEDVYEISLAQVTIVGGQTFIAKDAVKDERGIEGIAPWAGSNIMPSFNENALSEHINNSNIHVNPLGPLSLQGMLTHNWNEATNNGFYRSGSANALNQPINTLLSGVVEVFNTNFLTQRVTQVDQVHNRSWIRYRKAGSWTHWKETSDLFYIARDSSVDGKYPDPNLCLEPVFITDHPNMGGGGFWYVTQTFYATSNNRSQLAQTYMGAGDMKVRNYYEGQGWSEWSPSFQSVSDGKSLVANAITEKGVPTISNSTFATMANNIRRINTGSLRAVAGSAYAYSSGSNVWSFKASNLGPGIPKVVLIEIPTNQNAGTVLRGTLYYAGQGHSPGGLAGNYSEASLYLSSAQWVNTGLTPNMREGEFVLTYGLFNATYSGLFRYIALMG